MKAVHIQVIVSSKRALIHFPLMLEKRIKASMRSSLKTDYWFMVAELARFDDSADNISKEISAGIVRR